MKNFFLKLKFFGTSSLPEANGVAPGASVTFIGALYTIFVHAQPLKISHNIKNLIKPKLVLIKLIYKLATLATCICPGFLWLFHRYKCGGIWGVSISLVIYFSNKNNMLPSNLVNLRAI
jgi:hypothetical protein